MLFGRFPQLFLTMAQRALSQQIDDLCATRHDPVDTLSAIHESEYLYPIQHTRTLRIATNHLNSFLLALADTCRSHLYTVDVQVVEQHSGDDEFLVGQKAHTIGLLAVAEC